jgi:hypothetical protein
VPRQSCPDGTVRCKERVRAFGGCVFGHG